METTPNRSAGPSHKSTGGTPAIAVAHQATANKTAVQTPVHKPASATPTTATATRAPNPSPSAKPHGHRLENRKHGRRMTHERRPTSSAPRETKDENVIIPPIGDAIRIIPLGGVEEIGKNMTAIQFKDEIIVVDIGIQFSTEDTPGIDYILPNTKYLEDNKEKIKAVVITHGHLDHIGGLPYIMDRIGNPPVYTREFAALLIKKRFTEFPNLPALNLKIVEKDDGSLPIGKYLKVRFFGLTHSIPDSTGVIIETPYGDIVNTGDVRVDNTDGVPTDNEIEQYKIFKDRKILLLTMDSTGIDKPGWAMSEKHIVANIDKIVANVPGRIIIATFASQVERIIEFLNIAKKYGKKVVIEGRSMKVNVEIIKHLELADTKHIVPLEEVEKHPPHKIMMLATGAQGEEFAALMRMSNKSHKYIRLNSTDTIILSSSVIPGNERSVTTLKDNLFRHDCHIITYLDSDVHTSGHGKRGELEWIHKQIPYKFFMPVHGHHFMLKMHAELAAGLGVDRKNIIVPDNGNVVELYDEGTKIRVLKEKAPSSPMMVDGFSVGNIQEVVIRDRQMLAQDGMFVIIATVNSSNGKLRKSPDIISRGFVYLRESQDLLRQARFIIKKTIEDSTNGMNPINFDFVKTNVTDELSKFLFQETAKRPIVIPVILGV